MLGLRYILFKVGFGLLLIGIWLPALAIPDLSGLENDDATEFLTVDQAFMPSVQATPNGWLVNFDIADHYYLYRDRIHLKNSTDAINFRQKAEHKQDKNFGDVLIFHDVLDVEILATESSTRFLSYQGCSEDGLCYPPQTLFLGTVSAKNSPADEVPRAPENISPENTLAENALTEKSLFWVVLSFLGLGIGLSLTPCVFPMIPILSSIIVGQGKNISSARGGILALSYVVGMASSYALIGILVSAFGASFNLSSITQMPAVIAVSALLFIVLSLPMFGVFELQLPAFLRDKLNTAQSKQRGGAILSTFLMGFFAALVVSPCVSAPLAGALVYLSSTGDVLTGGVALFALGLGMGGPLILVGLSGGKLLPKAGQWMVVIKSAFGVGLLAVAIALLDRILPAQLTLLLSGALAIGVSVFLGVFDSATTTAARLARVMAVLALLTGVCWWLGAAMGNGNLQRPLTISFNSVAEGHEKTSVVVVTDGKGLQEVIEKSDKPVLVDIYADWCTSCRDMDELLHSPAMANVLSNYTLVKLDITAGTKTQQALLSEWQVFGPPALQRFDLEGNRQGKPLQGLPTVESFKRWLARS